jgi:hypothetical protein
VVDHLEADGAFPSSILQSTRLQCSRRRLRWTNEANTADQNKLIILNSTSTRTFSNYNIERTTHGRIHYKFAHSVVENTVDMISMTSNGNQGPVPWIKRLDMVHLTSPVDHFSPPGCNAHVGGYGGPMKPMPQTKMS